VKLTAFIACALLAAAGAAGAADKKPVLPDVPETLTPAQADAFLAVAPFLYPPHGDGFPVISRHFHIAGDGRDADLAACAYAVGFLEILGRSRSRESQADYR